MSSSITKIIIGNQMSYPSKDEHLKTLYLDNKNFSQIHYPGHITLYKTKVLGEILIGGTLNVYYSTFKNAKAGGNIILHMATCHENITANGCIVANCVTATSLKTLTCAIDIFNTQAVLIYSMNSYIKAQCCIKPIQKIQAKEYVELDDCFNIGSVFAGSYVKAKNCNAIERIEAKKSIEIDNCFNIENVITEGPAFVTNSKIDTLICAIKPSEALVIHDSQINTIHLYFVIKFFEPCKKDIPQVIELHNSKVHNVHFSEKNGTIIMFDTSKVTGKVTQSEI